MKKLAVILMLTTVFGVSSLMAQTKYAGGIGQEETMSADGRDRQLINTTYIPNAKTIDQVLGFFEEHPQKSECRVSIGNGRIVVYQRGDIPRLMELKAKQARRRSLSVPERAKEAQIGDEGENFDTIKSLRREKEARDREIQNEQDRIEQAKVDLQNASVSELVEKLKDKSAAYKQLVIKELGNRGPEAIPALVVIKDENYVGEALKQIQSRYGVSGIAQVIKDPNVTVRLYVLETLGTMGPEAIPVLISAIKDGSVEVRIKVIEALRKLGAKEAVPVVVEAMKDGDINVRLCAIDTLKKIGEKEALIPVLIKTLTDQETGVKVKAIGALGDIGTGAKAAVPILTQLLKDKDNSIVVSSIDTLGKIGKDARSAVPALIQIASKGETDAYDALEKIGTVEAKAAVERHRQHEKAVERARLAEERARIAKEAAAVKAKRAKFIAILREKGNLSGLELIRDWVAVTDNPAATMLLSKMLGAGTYMDFLYAREKPEAVFKVIEGFSRQGDMGVLILHSQTGLSMTGVKGILDAWRLVY
jgi:HEAT repeat protein